MRRRGGSNAWRAIGWGIAAAGMAGAALVGDRIRKVRRVPAELRSPLAYVPIPFNSATVRRLRSGVEGRTAPSRADVSTRAEVIPGLDGAPDLEVLLAERPDRPVGSPALLWIHGGYVIGNAAMATAGCEQFAHDLNALVVSVDHRLAPENPFPAGLDDCFAALVWLLSHADDLGIDPARLAIGGDSAGGGLAAALAQRAFDAGIPLALQLLRYPMLDDRTCLHKPRKGVGELTWTPAFNRFGWASYLGHPPGAAAAAPYAVPARRTNLTGLAPAWIGVGTADLFHDEDVAYAERLRRAGVPVTLEIVEGLYHAADVAAPDAPQSRRFYASQRDALRAALGVGV